MKSFVAVIFLFHFIFADIGFYTGEWKTEFHKDLGGYVRAMGYFPKSKASLVSSGFDFALPHIGAKMWIIHKDGLFTVRHTISEPSIPKDENKNKSYWEIAKNTGDSLRVKAIEYFLNSVKFVLKFTAEHINADVQLDTKFVDVLGEHRKIESVYKILPNFEKSVKKEALFMEQQRIAWLDPNEETGDANTKRKTVLADLTYYISEETTNAGKVTTRMTTEIKYQPQPGAEKTETATVKWVKVKDQTSELVVEIEKQVQTSKEKKAEKDRVEKEKREAEEAKKASAVKKSPTQTKGANQ